MPPSAPGRRFPGSLLPGTAFSVSWLLPCLPLALPSIPSFPYLPHLVALAHLTLPSRLPCPYPLLKLLVCLPFFLSPMPARKSLRIPANLSSLCQQQARLAVQRLAHTYSDVIDIVCFVYCVCVLMCVCA